MALTKAQILAEVNSLLASGTNIEASEHRQTMYSIIDTAYDSNIDGVSLGGTDLIFTRDGGNGQSITIDLSSLGAGIPEAPEDGKTYGRKDATWHEVVTTLPQSVERTGATLVFDVMEGAIYNAQTPSSSPTIIIDALTPAKRGCVVAFYNDGSVEPTITGAVTNPQAGTFVANQVNVYWFMWDGHSFTQNIQTKSPLVALVAPTFTLAAGTAALTLDYSNVVYDALATSGSIMQISPTGLNDWKTATGYISDTPSGIITGDTDGNLTAQTYDVRMQSNATAINSASPFSATETASASAVAQPPTPTNFAIAKNANDFVLSWDDQPTTADNYIVERGLLFDYSDAAQVYSGATNGYTDVGFNANNEQYYYRVKAQNTGATDSAFANDNIYGGILLFKDEFAGVNIDTAKWDVNDTSPD